MSRSAAWTFLFPPGVKPERALMTEATNVLGVALSGRSGPWVDEDISSSISGVNSGDSGVREILNESR
jgi:hypothetical protein